MSIENYFVSVEWEQYKKEQAENDEFCIFESIDEEEPWLSHIDVSYNIESVMALIQMAELFQNEKSKLNADSANLLKDVIGILCIDVNQPTQDLDQADEAIYSSMNKDTVKDFSKKIEKLKSTLDFDLLSSDFQNNLKSYCDELGNVFNKTSEVDRGLIIAVA